MGKPRDLTGQRFSRLIVIDQAEKGNNGQLRWNCICSCGAKTIVMGGLLKIENTRSCGCLAIDINTTHGMTKTPEYSSWKSMKGRCLNKTDPTYYRYGAEGITICGRWLRFENFYSDMGPRPSNTSLDRIDTHGNYEPNNCRWATATEQSQNRRTQRKSVSGVTGVFPHRNSWKSQITVNKKQINLYQGKDFEKACRLRREAEIQYNWPVTRTPG